MKTLDELKKEQYDAKAKLHELIEFINNEEFYNLSQSEKSLIGQRRIALEMYLNSLTKNIYDKEGSAFDISSAMWPLMMGNMFSGSSFGSSSNTDCPKKQPEESNNVEEDNTISE